MQTVTILSTVKNIRETLDPWLRSLIQQNYAGAFDIVIIDSCSTDGTSEILREYQAGHAKIKVYEYDSKQPEALNYAVRNHLCSGDLIALIDGDCVAPAGWLAALVDTIETKRADAVGGPGLTPEDANFTQKVIGYELDTRFLSIKEGVVGRQPNMNLIVKKSVLEKLLFDESLHIGYDGDFCYRFNQAGYKLWFNPQAIVYHYHRSTIRKYLKQQYLNAKFGIRLKLKSKNNLKADNINPITMLLQPVIFCLVCASLIVALVYPSLGIPAFGLSLVMLLIVFTFEVIKSYHIKRSILVGILYVLYTIRLPFWIVGIVSGILVH